MPPSAPKNLQTPDFVLFLTNEFSQWYPSDFTSKEGYAFNCAEQFMMHGKALLFGDTETAAKILAAKTPKEQKELGRQVRGFDAEVWESHARAIVYQGNYYKFTQNPHLYAALRETDGKQLAEAAHYDPVWGIGLHADDPRATEAALWQGKNWLGLTLTRLRDDLAAAGFIPPPGAPMIRFYDTAGQRMLYVPAAEFCGGLSLREKAAEIKGAAQDLSRQAKVYRAIIKGHGLVENNSADFYRLNKGWINLIRKNPFPRRRRRYKNDGTIFNFKHLFTIL